MKRLVCSIAVSWALLAFARPVAAQQCTPAEVLQARTFLESGIRAYDAHHDDQALTDLDRARRCAGNPLVVYNLARIYARRDDPARVVPLAEEVLVSDDPRITRRIRTEIERLRTEMLARTGTIEVSTDVSDAVVTLTVAGADFGTLPLAQPLRVNAGRPIVVGARAPGYDGAQREITVASGENVVARFTLHRIVERAGQLEVTSSLLGVEVRLDGSPVGTTPLSGSLRTTPGHHVVVGRRAGYVDGRVEVDVADGTVTTARLALTRDPNASPETLGRIRVRHPNVPTTLFVDDEPASEQDGMLVLPYGRHRVRIRVAERLEVELAQVEVPARGIAELTPEWRWDERARAERVSSASSQRTWGWVLGVSGAAAVVTGTTLFVVAALIYGSDTAEQQRALLDYCSRPEVGMSGECNRPPLLAQRLTAEDEERSRTDYINLLNTFGWIALGAGAAALGTGIYLLLAAPSNADIDAEASARLELELSPTHAAVELTGQF